MARIFMVLINLTKRCMQNHGLSFVKKAKRFFDLKWYLAYSLSDINSFDYSPKLLKKDGSMYSAIVIMKDVKVKRIQNDPSFNENSKFSWRELGRKNTGPLFEIEDRYGNRKLANWMAGNSKEYFEDLNKFEFHKDSFVLIPEISFKYRNNGNKSFLLIRSMENKYKKYENILYPNF